MSYTWSNGELITAEKLNETGSSGGGGLVATCDANGVLDKTWQEIHDAMASGSHVSIIDDMSGTLSILSVTTVAYMPSASTYIVMASTSTGYRASAPEDYPGR